MASYMNIIFKEIIQMLVLGVTSLSFQHTGDSSLHPLSHTGWRASFCPGWESSRPSSCWLQAGPGSLEVWTCCRAVSWMQSRDFQLGWGLDSGLASQEEWHPVQQTNPSSALTCDRGRHLAGRWKSLSWSWTGGGAWWRHTGRGQSSSWCCGGGCGAVQVCRSQLIFTIFFWIWFFSV